MALPEDILDKVWRLQFTGYAGVAWSTLILYDYILTFKSEGELGLFV